MDSKKKYEQMVEDGEITPKKYINHVARCNPLYIYLLDFSSGEVIRYNISALAKEDGDNKTHGEFIMTNRYEDFKVDELSDLIEKYVEFRIKNLKVIVGGIEVPKCD